MAIGDSITGTFGRLTVLDRFRGRDKAGASRIYAKCRCSCDGKVIDVMARDILRVKNPTRSCGCLKRESKSNLKHGMSNIGSRTYASWKSMLNRCNNENSDQYKWYGAKGVKVCERWSGCSGFERFLDDMGERPDKKTLDRFPDKTGNYEPSNCRWATDPEQQNNRTNNQWITIGGVTKTQKEWCIEKGFSLSLINSRVKSGMTPEQAVTTPLRKIYKRRTDATARV